MRVLLLTSALLLLASGIVQSAEQDSLNANEKIYEVTAQLGGGYLRDVSPFEDDGNDLNLSRNQFNVFGRILWRPGNLLTGGLEFGYSEMFVVTNPATGGEVVRSAIPLYLLFSMSPFQGADVSVGYGVAIINSTAKRPGQDGVVGTSVSTALMVAASYTYKFDDRWGLGLEGRYSYFDFLEDEMISLSLVGSYVLHTY